MNKSKRQLLVEKKQRLIDKIDQQRAALSAASDDWLQVTEPYDRTWKVIVTFRPIFMAAAGLLSIYTIKRPKRIFSLGKKALATWGVIRTIRGAVNSNQK
ncbi:YqjK-like family protein [Providencia rettgeri]|uniref:YqjK-like family protein n=1 Tax=Providencia stuartii TaxID=588 RepID=A0AAI9DD09_PROST|nr:YqjK-like family protein [Providencia stuartii]MDV5226547.1 YqjK-like family protein [Providencia rettgeri]